MLGQRHLFICDLYVRRLHRQMPVLEVVVEVEALVQHHLFVRLQQTEGKVFKRLVRPERVVKFTDVRGQILQGGLSKYGAVVAQVGGLAAEQVDLGVVRLSSAGQFGSQLRQFPVCAVDKLGAVVRLEPHGGVRAGVRANCPRLVVDPSLVVVLDPLGHVIKLVPWRQTEKQFSASGNPTKGGNVFFFFFLAGIEQTTILLCGDKESIKIVECSSLMCF